MTKDGSVFNIEVGHVNRRMSKNLEIILTAIIRMDINVIIISMSRMSSGGKMLLFQNHVQNPSRCCVVLCSTGWSVTFWRFLATYNSNNAHPSATTTANVNQTQGFSEGNTISSHRSTENKMNTPHTALVACANMESC